MRCRALFYALFYLGVGGLVASPGPFCDDHQTSVNTSRPPKGRPRDRRSMRDLIAIVENAGSLPPMYVEAMIHLGRVLQHAGGVVVGGAAVTFYTGGTILSGDFDFVIHMDNVAFAEAMRSEGFIAEDRQGHLRIGWYHPELPIYGFQSVSGPLFDGNSDPAKLRSANFRGNTIVFASPEDLIADRLGQQAVAGPTDHSRLLQARLLYRMVPDLDEDYMMRRIKQESGDPKLLRGGA